MTLEERLRALAKKGELVHLSVAYRASDGKFHANFAAASPHGGYSRGVDEDPVKAIEEALSQIKLRVPKVTAPVNRPEDEGIPPEAFEGVKALTEPQEKEGSLNEWTK